MGKWASDNLLDGGLDWAQANLVSEVVLSASATSSAAVAAACLASATTSSASFSFANGDLSGRKLTVASASGTAITASGSATHVTLCDSNGTPHLQTTCDLLPLTSGTVDIPAYDAEVGDPT